MNYAIKYPYTITIFSLLSIVILTLIIQRKKINWYRYNAGLIFSFIFGLIQIHGCVNIPNMPAWEFPEGSALLNDLGIRLGRIAFEDLLFIPVCYSLFYSFMALIKNVPDVFKGKISITSLLCIFVIVEAMIFQAGGKAAEILILCYTIPGILAIIIYCIYKKKSINTTHLILALIFVTAVNDIWELFNAWRVHWYYNRLCEIFSIRGFFFNYKLHISIFFQYPIAGFSVMYGCWIVFENRKEPFRILEKIEKKKVIYKKGR